MDFYIDPRLVALWAHILLFGYWLGSDLGVYFCDSQLVREDLSLDERLRVREIRYKLDLMPRTCLILLIALGFTLALPFDSPVRGSGLVAVWVACLFWLWVVWQIYFKRGTAAGERMAYWDIRWRLLVTASFIGFGTYCILTGGPIPERWLAAKMIVFGVIVLNGVWIRMVASRWKPIFDLVRAGGEDRVRGEALMKVNRVAAGRANMTIWTLVAIVAFLGATKPF